MNEIVQQRIGVVIVHFPTHHLGRFVHFTQYFVGGRRTHFNQSVFDQELPYFVHGRLFEVMGLGRNVFTNGSIGNKDPHFRTSRGFSNFKGTAIGSFLAHILYFHVSTSTSTAIKLRGIGIVFL